MCSDPQQKSAVLGVIPRRRFLLFAHSISANSPATMVAVIEGGAAYEAEILCGTEPAGMAAYH